MSQGGVGSGRVCPQITQIDADFGGMQIRGWEDGGIAAKTAAPVATADQDGFDVANSRGTSKERGKAWAVLSSQWSVISSR